MITVGFLKAGDRARVDYYLSRAALDETPRSRADSGEALGRYYAGQTANGPGRWLGRGADVLGLTDQAASPEEFTRAVLEGYVDGAARARPRVQTHPEGLVAAEPFAAAVRAVAEQEGGAPAQLFASGRTAKEWASLARTADRFGTVPATVVAKLARHVGGIDPAGLYGAADWQQALTMAGDAHRVDGRMAALDVVMAVDKSVSLLYATADDDTRSLILAEFHEACRSALGYLDTLAATAVRGSVSQGTAEQVGTDGLLAVGFVHDEARPTGDCACGDPHLHEHVLVLNTARGQDGRWSAIQHDRIAPNAKTAGYLFQAELRGRLTRQLGVQWRPVASGLSGLVGITDSQHRQFSKRHDEVAAELAAAGATGTEAGRIASRTTRQSKRAQLPPQERVARWQAEAATVGLDATAVQRVMAPPAAGPATVGPDRDAPRYPAQVLARLTEEASSFGRSELLRALAEDARHGASIAELTALADRILADPALVVALADGEGGLTTADVRRGQGGRVYAYAVEQKWTTPQQLQLEAGLVDAALRRCGAGCARLDEDVVDAVIGRQPFALTDEQAAAVRGLTTSGAGVDVLHAGAGSGKTTAVLGTVRQAYEAAGYRVIGATTSARAARVLADDGGLQAQTIARLLLDLDRPGTGGLPARTVLVVDEASMVGTWDMARLLQHAGAAAVKVVIVGDTRQLAAVDAGGGLRALQDRLGAQTLTTNRRQHAQWERDALANLAAGLPGQALRAYQAHGAVTVTDSGLAARRAMVAGWWGDVDRHGIDRTIMCAVRNVDRAELNRLARDVMRQAGRLGDDQVHAAGRAYAVGDRVMLLRNSAARRYDNGDTGTVTAIDEQRRLVVTLDRGSTETLAPAYLAAGHLDHAYAATVQKAQGSTVQTAHVLGTALAQEAGYVAMSRGREGNRLYLVQGDSPVDPELDLPTPQTREAYATAAKTLGTSQAKRLALDKTVWGEGADQLRATLAETARLLRTRPVSDIARLPALRAQLVRLEGQVLDVGLRLDGLSERHARLGRRDPERGALAARLERQASLLGALEHNVQQVMSTIAVAEARTTPRDVWDAEHAEPIAGAVAAGRELAWRARAARRVDQATRQEPALTDPAVQTPASIEAGRSRTRP